MIAYNVQLTSQRVRVVLYRRKAGAPYYARWWFDGTEHHRSTKAFQEAAARSAARRLVEQCELDGNRGPLSLTTAISQSLETRFPTEESKTKQHYKGSKLHLDKFAEWAGDVDLSSKDFDGMTQLVQAYLDHRKKDLADQSIIVIQRVLSRFCTWLSKRKMVPWRGNPASVEELDLPKVFPQPKPPMTQADLVTVLREMRTKSAWAALLLCLSGLRPVGTQRVQWSDIDLEAGTVRVFEKRRPRDIPLAGWIVQELKAWKKTHAQPVEVSKNMIHEHMARIRRKFNLSPSVTLNGARRTFISLSMDRGISAELVASVCGNSVAVIERHYKDLRTLNARQAVESINLGVLIDDPTKNPTNKAV